MSIGVTGPRGLWLKKQKAKKQKRAWNTHVMQDAAGAQPDPLDCCFLVRSTFLLLFYLVVVGFIFFVLFFGCRVTSVRTCVVSRQGFFLGWSVYIYMYTWSCGLSRLHRVHINFNVIYPWHENVWLDLNFTELVNYSLHDHCVLLWRFEFLREECRMGLSGIYACMNRLLFFFFGWSSKNGKGMVLPNTKKSFYFYCCGSL